MKLPTAAKAYKRAQRPEVQAQLNIIATQINTCAAMGYLETNFFNYPLARETVIILRAYGYEVTETKDSVNIKWTLEDKNE